VLTANLALRYHSPLSVGIGAVAALWAVAGLAVWLGPRLLGVLSARDARTVAAVVLLVLTGVTAWQAAGAA
jgi:putative Ca2+/H+ antiporter (TMEM165/GDT1 family)